MLTIILHPSEIKYFVSQQVFTADEADAIFQSRPFVFARAANDRLAINFPFPLPLRVKVARRLPVVAA